MPGDAPESTGGASTFSKFLADDWKEWILGNPEFGTVLGFPGVNDRWTDDSPAGIAAREGHLSRSLDSIRRFDRDRLDVTQRLNYDLYRDLLETAVEGRQYGHDPFPFMGGTPRCLWTPINQLEGIHVAAGDMVDLQPHTTPQDYADLLARLVALPAAVDQQIALLKTGVEVGVTLPRVAVTGVPQQMANLTPADPSASPLLERFEHFPAMIPESERARLREAAHREYTDRVAPAFERLRRYFAGEYLPACRDEVGCSSLPNGAAAYRFRVKWTTTTSLTPEEIHEIGLAEVRRLDSATRALMAETHFHGTFEEFTKFLRHDPQFLWPTAEALLDGYRIVAKKIDPELGRLFGRLPRLPYGVHGVPSFREATSPAAYYFSGSPTTGRAGIFYANTYQVGIRPRWEMDALTLHEAVPGHHLQLALAQELEHLPEFRRDTGPTAFVEGWGLYAESLGAELGCYTNPYSRMGQITFDMWRSIRLVVDTGMHAMGWTRERALQFFRDHTGMSETGITVEVDRYIVWPGQALAYKVGQLKIRELRAWAESRLGPRFDVRAFHDLVLTEGALPLTELEHRVHAWADRVAAG